MFRRTWSTNAERNKSEGELDFNTNWLHNFFLFFLTPNTARQEIENKLTASNSEVELDLETKIRIEKLENAIKETQKVVHAPSFKLLSKELKKIEDCRLARVSSKSLSNKGSSNIINNVFLKIDRFFNFL